MVIESSRIWETFMRRSLSEHDARRLLVPGPVVLVTTSTGFFCLGLLSKKGAE